MKIYINKVKYKQCPRNMKRFDTILKINMKSIFQNYEGRQSILLIMAQQRAI